MEVDLQLLGEYERATALDKIRDLSEEELDKYLAYFAQAREQIEPGYHHQFAMAGRRYELLSNEKDRRDRDEKHTENQCLDRWTLFVAVVGVIVGAVVGVNQCRESKQPPSPPTVSHDIQLSIAPVEQTEPSQATPMPIQTPESAVALSESPQESPQLSPTPRP